MALVDETIISEWLLQAISQPTKSLPTAYVPFCLDRQFEEAIPSVKLVLETLQVAR